ncbi:neuronal acetylcholine receptor subunit alpha-7-like isoform X1 [Takifugu flavidus]|uniref:Neuronal acetylcholine receptor subunit alpha-7 n=1 Tax=Takifugu flavidus TaxID=433684 RepID=A0A5C6NJG9_9TELE|nr:neuronal acetylcholine receptor subunit alpha-7-like isoform X1 [Takifugu flavidus]TWW67742.1 Neuronal acetylcholine receptor subunit alpha-7 [Takifugu flavidus]
MWNVQIFLMVLAFSIKDTVQGPTEERLYEHLLRRYNSMIRPVANDSETLTVRLGLSLMQIMDVDEKNQILTTNVWLQMEWTDSYLTWDVSEYPGMNSVRLPSRNIWKPDILLYNSADERFDATYHTNVVVVPSGNCTYVPPGILKSTCHIDVRWFPFDVQRCDLKFGSWSHGSWTLDLQMLEADISSYIPNGEWDLLEVKGRVNQRKYDCCEETYPDVTFTVVMQRRTLYYGINLLLPCVLISTLALLVFVLPADSGEKISLGITVLLSMTVFMLMVAEIMPATSESVPLIAQYFAAIMVIVGLSVIATVVVLQHHHHDPCGEKMPKWTRVFLLDCCASFLCMKRPGEEQVPLTGPSKVQHRSLVYELNEDTPGPQPTNVYPSISGLKSSQTTGVPGGRAGEDETLLAKGPGSSAGNIERELAKLLDEVHSIAKHFRKQDVNMAMSNDWKFAALVIDRLCLVAFSVITILCTIGILMSAPRFVGAFSKNFN